MGERHIIAMGGGGFSDNDSALDDFVLGLTGVDEPRVCFIPTASGDASSYIERFYTAFNDRSCRPTHLSLFQPPYPAIGELLLAQDAIYVGGGSTANMLAIWRVHGVDGVLRRAWERGVVLCGILAGAICWFGAGVTDSLGPALAPMHGGLGFLGGSFCPHYDGEPERRPAYHRFVREGRLPSSRRDRAGYHVEAQEDVVTEARIEPRVLAGATEARGAKELRA